MNARASAPAVATTCPYCGVGCGIVATPEGEGDAAIAGDASHPANAGRLCVKGAALGETLGTEARLLYSRIHGVGATWPRALDAVAAGFVQALDGHGPQSIAMYLSGQLLTEDYYVANKLMKGFLGSANVDTSSRLCMASTVAGHRRAFGADVAPGCYEDFDEADLIVFVGANSAWRHPVLFQRAERSKARRGARLVVIDPRRTASAELADLHLPIAPGADAILFGRLMVEIAESAALDRAYVDAHTADFAPALARARKIAPDRHDGGALRPRRRRSREFPKTLDRHAACRHRLQPGRQPVGAGDRQGQCDPQCPSCHRADRPAGLRSVLADRPAQCDGRARGRRPR